MRKKISILLGSSSDLSKVEKAREFLEENQIPYEIHILSAHRTPDELRSYLESSQEEVGVYVACAGLAAHLPGVVASFTLRPVVGVPLRASSSDGMDALLSIVQMPPGIPVGCVGIDNVLNGVLYALSILALEEESYKKILKDFREKQKEKVLKEEKKLQEKINRNP